MVLEAVNGQVDSGSVVDGSLSRVEERAAPSLEQEVKAIGAEIESSIAGVKAKRQELIEEELRSFFHAAFAGGEGAAPLDHIVKELESITAEVRDSVARIRARLESLVQLELTRAVESALGNGKAVWGERAEP